jgi:hypothetical protein
MQPAYQEYAARFGMVSLLLVPLRVRGRVVAVLGVSRDEPPELDDVDERFVVQIGAVIAVALDNDRCCARPAPRSRSRTARTSPLTGRRCRTRSPACRTGGSCSSGCTRSCRATGRTWRCSSSTSTASSTSTTPTATLPATRPSWRSRAACGPSSPTRGSGDGRRWPAWR